MSQETTARLELRFLGSFQVRLDGAALVGFRSDKARALLAYLAIEAGRPLRRDSVASLLWSTFDERAARRSLTSALGNLRRLLAPLEDLAILSADPQTVEFRLVEPQVWSDVAVFRSAVHQCSVHPHRSLLYCAQCIDRLEQAVQLYEGDFLAGFHLGDSASFDDWRSMQSEALHQAALDALNTVTSHYLAMGQYSTAERYARRLLLLEPWNEAAHRQLMTALALSGQRAAALTQFELCVQTLARELAVPPEPATVRLANEIRTGAVPPPEPLVARENPYKGLRAFRTADATDFFGREAFVDQLVQSVQNRPLTAVIGPSGSGKSSVVQAGLLQRLSTADSQHSSENGSDANGPGSGRRIGPWLVLETRPGADPFHSLAAALAPFLLAQPYERSRPSAEAIAALAQNLRLGRLTLDEAARQILARPLFRNTRRILLLIDQFEEAFALCHHDDTRLAYLDALVSPVRRPNGDCSLTELLVLRADFMGKVLLHRPLADALQDGGLILGPMTRPELEQAVVMPAQAQGVRFQDGLVARILDDVGQSPGRLPLLQFALTQLWEYQDQGYLTHAAYEAIGRVEGALAKHAEEFYGTLAPTEQVTVRRVLMQLVTPGQGTEDTRRPSNREEIGEEDWPIVQKLADARLVVTDQDASGQEVVDIVHEALIRGWDRLRGWLDADRAFRIWQQRIRWAVEQWETTGEDAGALLRGAPLAEAEAWLAARPGDVGARTRLFVTASMAQREAERAAVQEQQARELAQAQALAEAERRRADQEARSRHRLRRLAVGLVILALLATVATFLAFLSLQEADSQRDLALRAEATSQAERELAQKEARRALSRQLAAQSISLLEKKPDLALLLAVQARRLAETATDLFALPINLRLSPYLEAFLHGNTGAVYALATSPDNRTVASGSDNGLVFLWDIAAKRLSGEPLQHDLKTIYSLAFDRTGQLLAAGDAQGHLVVWDLASRTPRLDLPNAHADVIDDLRFDPAGNLLTSTSDDHTVKQWNVQTGEPVGSVANVGPDETLRLSPNSQQVATVLETVVSVRDVATGEVILPPLARHSDNVQDLEFSPDGEMLVTSSFDGTTMLWDMSTGEQITTPLTGHTGRVLASTFSPDGRLLATGGADGAIILWDVARGQPLGAPLTGHSNWVRALAFTPDGGTLISGGTDGRVILWSLTRHRDLAGHEAKVRALAFGPDGKTLLSGGFDNTVRLWDVEMSRPLFPPVAAHKNSVLAAAMSPDGKIAATGSAGEPPEIILWDVTTGKPIGQPLVAQEGPITHLAFSPDGRTLAASSFDKTVALWDVAGRRLLTAPMSGHDDWVMTVSFSPDGRLVATGGADATVRLWDAATGAAVGEPFRGHTNWVTSLDFSPDSRVLATGSSDSTVRLWDVASGRAIGEPLVGHSAPVWGVAFDSADGSSLLTLGGDGTYLRWDLTTRDLAGLPLVSGVEAEGMALSPDRQAAASGAFNSTGDIHVWLRPEGTWFDQACRIANRNFTEEEWRQYLGDTPFEQVCPAAVSDAR